MKNLLRESFFKTKKPQLPKEEFKTNNIKTGYIYAPYIPVINTEPVHVNINTINELRVATDNLRYAVDNLRTTLRNYGLR
jgi:hypothetical protein